MSHTERRICDRLFANILAHDDLLFRIHDGEDWSTDWTRDVPAARQHVAATDETRIFITRVQATGAARRVGSILLIHGNEEDVISDSSWNPRVEDAEQLIDRLCDMGPTT